MKVALIHDYLNQLGGAERVLLSLMKLFPEAPIYTILYDKKKTLGLFEGRVRGTSFLDFQFARDHHRLFIPLMPAAAKSINLGDEYDLIISDTAGFAKGITYGKRTKHISYIHTPLRYAWETNTYFGGSLLSRLFAFIFAPAFAYVRRSDHKTGQKPDVLIANSKYIAAKIRQYFGREASVVYPPVDIKKFYFDPAQKSGEYYLALGRLLEYKRFDLIIQAFNELGLPLKIVGAGRLEKKLKSMARSPKIEFVPFQPEDKLRDIYAGAQAFIMANDEDFGLVMAEAQACGTPVIAYARGGALEIIEDGKTGVLFSEQTPQALIAAVKKFETLKLDRAVLRNSSEKFSEENFQKAVQEAVNRVFTK